jgi:hypothetical protein
MFHVRQKQLARRRRRRPRSPSPIDVDPQRSPSPIDVDPRPRRSPTLVDRQMGDLEDSEDEEQLGGSPETPATDKDTVEPSVGCKSGGRRVLESFHQEQRIDQR